MRTTRRTAERAPEYAGSNEGRVDEGRADTNIEVGADTSEENCVEASEEDCVEASTEQAPTRAAGRAPERATGRQFSVAGTWRGVRVEGPVVQRREVGVCIVGRRIRCGSK